MHEPAAPYPGLRPFRREEMSIFFGREEQTDQLLERLGRSRFLGVVGVSGCGKSSLVLAGMIPALEAGFLASAGARWRVVTMRPGSRPMRRLADALIETEVAETGRQPDGREVALLHSTLRRGPLGLVEALHDRPLPERTSLLVLVDQFEEIFRYNPRGDHDEADAFVALLLATARQTRMPVYVVITMRSDFLGECAVFNGLPEALNESQFLTPRPTRKQRRAAILGPAGVFGASVEPALVNRLLNDMGEEPDQLPLMQHVLMRLWNRAHQSGRRDGSEVVLTLEAYHAIGGFADALSRHADEAFAELDSAQQTIAERMFRALTERGSGQSDTRRPAALGEIAAICGAQPEQVAEVAEVFRRADRSFLLPAAGIELNERSVLDISHESLIRQWRRMNEWTEREALSAGIYERLIDTALLWRDGQAGLWGSPDLDLALDWRQRGAPTAAWAERYGGEFDVAMEFLTASVDKRHKEEAEEERARVEAEEQRRTRQRSLWLTIGLAVALVLASFSAFEARLARNRGWVAEEGSILAQARAVMPGFPQRGLLMAAEALDLGRRRRGVTGRVRQTMQTALTNVGGDPLAGHTAALLAVAVSPDGKWIATGSADKTVRLWPLAGWKFGDPVTAPRVLTGHGAPVMALAFSPDGSRLASGSEDKTVRLWDLNSDDPRSDPEVLETLDSGVVCLSFSPNGRWLAVGVFDRAAAIWDLTSSQPAALIPLLGHADTVTSVAFDPDSRWLFTGSADNTARRWDLLSADLAASALELTGHRGPVLELVVSPDGRWLATASADSTARLWPLTERDPNVDAIELRGHRSTVTSVAFSPDSHRLATGSSDRAARLWRVGKEGSAEGSVALSGHAGPIESVKVSSDGRWLVTASLDKTALLWDLAGAAPDAPSKTLRGHDGPLKAMAVSPDSRWLITASADKTARRWNLSQPLFNAEVVVLPSHADTVRRVATAPGQHWLATASDDSTARIWSLTSSNPGFTPKVLRGHASSIMALAVSRDGRWLATGSADNTARLWDMSVQDPAAEPRLLIGHQSSVTSVAFDRQTRWLATGSRDGTVRLWDLARPGDGPEVLAAGDVVSKVTFSPDGTMLAAGNADAVLRLWEMEAEDRAGSLVELTGHNRPITDLAFTPDGRWLVTGSWDRTARIWDLASAKRGANRGSSGAQAQLAVLRGHQQKINAVAVSPDGRRLATASADATVRVWSLAPAEPGRLLAKLRGHQDAVKAVAFGAEGRWLLSGSSDETARYWDLDAPDPSAAPGILRGHTGPVVTVMISEENLFLITGSEDDNARLWNTALWTLNNDELFDRACNRAGRNLTKSEWEQLLPDRPFHKICPGLPIPSADDDAAAGAG